MIRPNPHKRFVHTLLLTHESTSQAVNCVAHHCRRADTGTRAQHSLKETLPATPTPKPSHSTQPTTTKKPNSHSSSAVYSTAATPKTQLQRLHTHALSCTADGPCRPPPLTTITAGGCMRTCGKQTVWWHTHSTLEQARVCRRRRTQCPPCPKRPKNQHTTPQLDTHTELLPLLQLQQPTYTPPPTAQHYQQHAQPTQRPPPTPHARRMVLLMLPTES